MQHIESLSKLGTSYQNDNPEDLLNAVAQKPEGIGTCAGEQNMSGFQNACFLLENSLLETSYGSVYKAPQQLINNWIELAKNYINHADDSNAENILNISRSDYWPAPLLETIPTL